MIRGRPHPRIASAPGAWLGELKPQGNEIATFSGAVFRVPGETEPESLTLEPFYKIYRRNYEVYWDQFTPDQWQGQEKELRRRWRSRGRSRRARWTPSNQARNKTNAIIINSGKIQQHLNSMTARCAWQITNGWFSWDLKVLPDQPQDLEITFGGGGRGNARMDVFVDGDKLTTEESAGGRRGPRDRTFSLSAEQLKGKSKITVKFQAPPDARGGSVFGVRIMKRAESSKSTGT